jgi:hypothetical protein
MRSQLRRARGTSPILLMEHLCQRDGVIESSEHPADADLANAETWL